MSSNFIISLFEPPFHQKHKNTKTGREMCGGEEGGRKIKDTSSHPIVSATNRQQDNSVQVETKQVQ
jgi:hypothetical protein